MPFWSRLVLGAVVWCLVCAGSSRAEITFGVNAPRGLTDATETWGALGKYLSDTLQERVTIVPLSVVDLVAEVQKKDLHFVLANPVQMVHLKRLFQVMPLLSMSGHNGPQFAGVIVARRDSGLQKAKDLKGKKVVSLSSASAGAYIFPAYHMLQNGIDVRKDFASLQQTKKQDDLVILVQQGSADAAFVRSGLLEALAQEGKIHLADFVILDQRQDPTFPLLHTTVLYPEWFVTAMSKATPDVVQKIKAALLQVTPTSEAARAADIRGFVEPLSLEGLEQAMQALGIPVPNL